MKKFHTRAERTVPTPVRLSLSMIVKNEEARLAACLESMAGVANEVVIVDTGSTDATMEIARRFGARVFTFPWNGSFSDARNESLRHCTGDWVIFLDADERLDRSHAPRLRALLNDPSVAAYELTVVSKTFDQRNNVGCIYGYIPRLFRRSKEVNFQYRIHESVLPSVIKTGGKVARADVTIHHIGYDGGDEEMQHKFRRNLVPLRLDAADFPDDLFVLEKLSQTEMMLRHDKEAEAVLRHIISLLEKSASGPLYEKKAAHNYNLLSELCLWNDRLAECEAFAINSLSASPRQYQAYALLSRVYERQGRYEQALSAVERLHELCRIRPPFLSAVEGDCNVLEEDILYKQAVFYKKQGRDGAILKETLEAALRANENHRAAQTELAVIYAGEGRPGDVARVLRTLPRTDKQYAGLLYLRGQSLAKEGRVPAAIDDLWAAFSFGVRDDGIIFLLVRLLNDQQREREAIPLYEEYLSRHEHASDARLLLEELYAREKAEK